MTIKHENGMVTYLMRTGKDMVRSQMTIGSAQAIIKSGSELYEKDGQVVVDDKYFFPVEVAPKRKKKTEESEK